MQRVSDGATVCKYSDPVQEDAEPIYPELNATDPPYMIAWVTAGVSLLAVMVSLLVISTTMAAPKKKKGDEDDVGDDWMNEFIGTSAEPDMAAITGTAPAENKSESKSTQAVDDDDPFAVNVVQPKRRRKKKSSDDDDDGEDEEESPRKRPRKRRAPARKRPARRKRSD